MKKILTLLCTGLMAFSLVGCSKKTEETVEEPKTVVESGPVVEEKKTEEKEEEIKEVESEKQEDEEKSEIIACDTLEAATTLAGFDATVNEKGTKEYFVEVGEAIQVNYTDEAGNVTIAKKVLSIAAKNPNDVSGVDGLKEKDTLNVDNVAVTVKGDDDADYLLVWKNGEYSYSVYADNGLNKENLAELVSLIK